MTKPYLLTFETIEPWDLPPMEADYTLVPMPESGKASDLPAELIPEIRAMAFKGHSTLGPDIIGAFPNLGLISNYGVGYDTIDVAYATSKGIKVTNTPDVLTDDVADLAVGMVIAQSRSMVGASDYVRSGDWSKLGPYAPRRKVSGKRVGIVGLGRIGRAVAERMVPFGCEIHYYARSEKETPGWVYHDNVVDLAGAVDNLIICVSGGPETAGIVSRDAIAALGPNGLLVNASRGTTVDEDALLDALESKAIWGAGLDVFLNEPHIDPRFMKLDNVLLQPHQSSGSIETRTVMGQLQRDNIAAFFAGKPLLTPVN